MKVPMRDEEDFKDPENSELGFFSYLFMAIGILICALSGTCTLLFVINGFRASVDTGFMMMILGSLVGGIPFGFGLMMYSIARATK